MKTRMSNFFPFCFTVFSFSVWQTLCVELECLLFTACILITVQKKGEKKSTLVKKESGKKIGEVVINLKQPLHKHACHYASEKGYFAPILTKKKMFVFFFVLLCFGFLRCFSRSKA